MELIHDRLKAELSAKGLSALQASKAAGLSDSQSLRDVLGGRKRLTAELLGALVLAVGVDGTYVLTGQRSAGVLNPEERTMLDYFRGASPTARRAAMGALLGAASPSMGQITQSGSGVHQVNTGDGAVMIGSGSAIGRRTRKGSAS